MPVNPHGQPPTYGGAGAHELSGMPCVGLDYLRSDILAPSFSSIVLLGFRDSPWIPSPAA
jgi:hypothetical protein